MGRDTRHFELDLRRARDGALWEVYRAIERAAQESAGQYQRDMLIKVSAQHPTGTFERNTVTEAQDVAVRNGFDIKRLMLDVEEVIPARDDTTGESYYLPTTEPWVRAVLDYDKVKVYVMHGTEVEVNGVYGILRQSAEAALKADSITPATTSTGAGPARSGTSPVPSQPRRWWNVALAHPLVLATVAPVVVAAIIAYLNIR